MPTISEALAIALAHHQSGRLDLAEQVYRQILLVDPEQVETLHRLGLVAHQTGRLALATDQLRKAIALAPDVARYHNSLGNLLLHKSELGEAIACYHRAIELDPGYAEAYSNLGVAYRNQGDLDRAAASCRRATELQPDYVDAISNLGCVLQALGQPSDAIQCWLRAMQCRPQYAAACGSMLHTMHFCPDCGPRAICNAHRQWDRIYAEPLKRFVQPHPNDRSPDRRLRVGYVSPDFREHVIGLNLLPLLEQHDHERFEIVCYADVICPDGVTERSRRAADQWRSTVGLTDPQLSELVRQDSIDILVDLTLHLAGSRLLAFARKPAPVQVTFAGYPGTTGLWAIDYRLTDPYLDPPGAGDEFYTEHSVRLPDTFWCYSAAAGELGVEPLPALTGGYVTFGCLNNFSKVNEKVLLLWAQVLEGVDRSRLILSAPVGSPRQRALDRLRERGIAADRVTLVGHQPRLDYLRTYHSIDIALDTFPYNGHTTSLDALWMGVPVVTLAGQTAVGRAGVSQLMNLGLPELIAQTPADFLRIAGELAGDVTRLAELRTGLRQRMSKSPLMDAAGFTRGVEAAFRRMWQDWCGRKR